jgi:pterin-4a-carbinolamine dehydratase
VSPSIFINYRRSDSQHAAFAIAERLKWAFGADEVFFDRGTLQAGDQWPQHIRDALDGAKVVLAIIGPNWLRTADKYGRRRIDNPADWVRIELCRSLAIHSEKSARQTIIQVLVGGAESLEADALDDQLKPLTTFNNHQLFDAQWDLELNALVDRIATVSGLARIDKKDERNPNGSPVRPRADQRKQIPLSDSEVHARLQEMQGWSLVWSPHPWGNGGRAQEITKRYAFESFGEAVAFMSFASGRIEQQKIPHHPRWENMWKVVDVYFTTWDVGCRVTRLDFDPARLFDRIYRDFIASHTQRE